ncbi:MAG: VanZ family protein [Clostridia bacterium]|nr:VanZ family protein [Clostridia bacterium]
MEVNRRKIIYLFLIIIWMIIVFAFSNQPADISSKTSGGITEKVVKAITKDDKKISKRKRDIVEIIVRKCAHFVLYAIGGFLIANYINTTNVQDKRIILYTIVYTLIYAITDEIHQFFVEGRSSELRDIIIDTAGGSFGTILFIALKGFLRRK